MPTLRTEELAAFAKTVPKPAQPLTYGTAGFRTKAELLPATCLRMGALAVLRGAVTKAVCAMPELCGGSAVREYSMFSQAPELRAPHRAPCLLCTPHPAVALAAGSGPEGTPTVPELQQHIRLLTCPIIVSPPNPPPSTDCRRDDHCQPQPCSRQWFEDG